MKRTDRYYKLIRMPNEQGLHDWVSEISNGFIKVLPKLKLTDDFLLLEKSCYNDYEGTSEYYTNAFSFSGNEEQLYKITKKYDVFDYTGVSYLIIHHKQKIFSWNVWSNMSVEEKKL